MTTKILKYLAVALFLGGCSFSCSECGETSCDCKNELYMYPHGDKKEFLYEHLLNNWLFVGFRQGTQKEEIVRYINQTGLFKTVDESQIFDSPFLSCLCANEDNYALFVKTKRSRTCTQLKEIIRRLENAPIVSFANLTFEGNKFSDIPMHHQPNLVMSFTPCFYVYAKDADDLSDLYAVVQETKTKIVCQVAEWFYLTTDETSIGNAMQTANYFYETGKFKYACPDFILQNVNINK